MFDPFCDYKSIAHEIFYEDEYFYGIYNLNPIVPGHVLLISKRHAQSFLDLNKDELNNLIPLLQKVLKAVLKTYNCKEFDLSIQNGPIAGQIIPHFHLHIIPRKPRDIEGSWHRHLAEQEKKKGISKEEIIRNVEIIRRNLK